MRGLTPFAPPRTLPFARLRTFGLAVVSSVELPRSGLAKPFRAPPSLSAVACSFSKRPRPKVAHASSVSLVADWRSHFEPRQASQP